MRILYYSSAVSGSGHIVQGISIANAFKRDNINCTYLILHNSEMGGLADRIGVPQLQIPFENEDQLSPSSYRKSALFAAIKNFSPDIILVDLSWFMLHSFISMLPAKKVFLCRRISENAFSIPLPNGEISFDPKQYDLMLQTEPFDSFLKMKQINPIIIRNRDEIFTKNEGLEKLGLETERPICMFAFNGNPGDFERIKMDYSYLEDEYEMVYTSNYNNGNGKAGLFPVADYFNAVDFLVCGAGYNAFWEAVYFEKEAFFVPIDTRFENQYKRIEECIDFRFSENGADQLINIVINL